MSVAELAADDALAAVIAGLLSRGAAGQRATGGGVQGGEATSAFTRPSPGVGQAEVGTPAIVVGAEVGS